MYFDTYFELEKQLMGFILFNLNNFRDYLEQGLKSEHFKISDYRKAFEKLCKIYDEKFFVELGDFAKTDSDWNFAEELIENTRLATSGKAIRDLIEHSNQLKLKNEIEEIIEKKDLNVGEKIDLIMNGVENYKNIDDKKEVYNAEELNSVMHDFLDTQTKQIEFPYQSINEFVDLEPGSLITVGARPSMGKTAFAINLMHDVSNKYETLYINLEMSELQIIQRLISLRTQIPLHSIKKKNIHEKEYNVITRAFEGLSQLDYTILSSIENNNFNVIVNQIRKLHREKKFKVIIIDYLTLMTASGFQNKNYEVEYMANSLKRLATELNCCIVCLVQLNRSVETRSVKDKKPQLSDIRDSGGIEQASNVVAFLHREDYYFSDSENTDLEFIIRKNRNGDLGVAKLFFDKKTQKIGEIVK